MSDDTIHSRTVMVDFLEQFVALIINGYWAGHRTKAELEHMVRFRDSISLELENLGREPTEWERRLARVSLHGSQLLRYWHSVPENTDDDHNPDGDPIKQQFIAAVFDHADWLKENGLPPLPGRLF